MHSTLERISDEKLEHLKLPSNTNLNYPLIYAMQQKHLDKSREGDIKNPIVIFMSCYTLTSVKCQLYQLMDSSTFLFLLMTLQDTATIFFYKKKKIYTKDSKS